MEWLSDGALPMGMVFFAMTVLGFFRKRAGHVVARAQYPKLAQKLGLEYRPSGYKTGVGQISGQYRGHQVTVDPDDQRRIYVRFRQSQGVDIWRHEHNKRPRPGLRSYRPSDRRVVGFFKTIHADAQTMERLEASRALGDLVDQLKNLKEIKSLSLTDTGVTAIFDFGAPPYIPADVVEIVLPALSGMAQLIEGEPEQAPLEKAL